MFIPSGLYLWLVVSALVVVFDAAYVLLRPHSLRGGKYFHIFAPYELYAKMDSLYAMNDDSFVVIQSWLNIVEAVLLLLAVGMSISRNVSRKLWGAILAVVTSAFVFWKTVIFLLYDYDYTSIEVKQLTSEALLCYVLPSSLWIIFPILSIWLISKRVVNYALAQGLKQE